jgi:pimeloyl-ACP methyl ester carboxylesterase
VLVLGLAALRAPEPARADPVATHPTSEGEMVVLLHGLGRTDRSMRSLEARLTTAGFGVANLRYPSTELGPDALVALLDEQIEACCRSATRLHFVSHSLGGILVRAYLAKQRPPNLGRVVMLAPPNHGSELVDALGGSRLFESAFGPTATELGTDPESLPNRLPPPDFELGVIAGTARINPLGTALVPGTSDGTVSVESTKLPGMTDFVTVPASHTFIMRSEAAAQQVVCFLREGRFQHDGTDDSWPRCPAPKRAASTTVSDPARTPRRGTRTAPPRRSCCAATSRRLGGCSSSAAARGASRRVYSASVCLPPPPTAGST